MKNIFFILSFFLLLSCETKNIEHKETNNVIRGCPIEIYTVDSCEYIGYVYNGSGSFWAHSGNCKHCLKRNKN